MHSEQVSCVDERPQAAGRAHDDLARAVAEPLGILHKGKAADECSAGERLREVICRDVQEAQMSAEAQEAKGCA